MQLLEKVINVFDRPEKEKYVDEVWHLLQTTYAKKGGIKGKGFSSKDDMIENIPFWKLIKRDGHIVAASLYKNENGWKRVASGTERSVEGVKGFDQITNEDFKQKRAYAEMSDSALKRVASKVHNFKSYVFKPEDAEKVLDMKLIYPVPETDEEVEKFPEFKDYFYQREIGGHLLTKLLAGFPEQNKEQEMKLTESIKVNKLITLIEKATNSKIVLLNRNGS